MNESLVFQDLRIGDKFIFRPEGYNPYFLQMKLDEATAISISNGYKTEVEHNQPVVMVFA